ncbi:MAG: hypothetical protein HDR50_02285 [Desulfovibrio sp.]|uniref:hypothetical protein n=1 Tax=Desulfovibrio sp. TaxID=885 RepID=UPI001A77E751|nr:hypothetical protein [Desulfovibrio sp.]MBD5416503.1 hypothetical protein [Desulfovibrio sp.]
MDESCIYEGMRAVCAVLAELEAAAPERPALRLAERHLHLLAELAARGAVQAPEGDGPAGEGAPAQPSAGARVSLPAPEGACHVLQ